MIFDFGCRHIFDFFEFALPAFPGALAVLVVVMGLALIGKLIARDTTFEASDIFVGWGFVAGAMTLAAVSFPNPLLFVAFGLFVLMISSMLKSLRSRYFSAPFWVLALFPGLFVLTIANATGLGGYAFDDFSHWVPNALFVWQHDGVPSHAVPSVHSIYPGYPYGIPFLTYLSSLIAGGFLVQGGAMINLMLLFAFAAMLIEYTEKEGEKLTWRKIGLTALAMTLAVFFNSSIATFGLTNQGDSGTMALCGALALMLMSLIEFLRGQDLQRAKTLCVRLAFVAVAFVLIKQVNIFLLALLAFGFLVIAIRNGVLISALLKLPLILIPAIAFRVIWEVHAQSQIGGGGVGIQPIGAWRFELFPALWLGVVSEVLWKPAFFIFFVATLICGIVALFRPRSRWCDFAIFASIVQIGYAAFLVVAFLGSDFRLYTIRLAASFHRYMLHAVILALPALWLAAQALAARIGAKKIVLPQRLSIAAAVLAICILPAIMIFNPDWVSMKADSGLCMMRKIGHSVALQLPDQSEVGAIMPKDPGLVAFILSNEFALQDARGGPSQILAWHADKFLTFDAPNSALIADRLKEHPRTNAILYTEQGDALLKELKLDVPLDTGFIVRENGKWISKPILYSK